MSDRPNAFNVADEQQYEESQPGDYSNTELREIFYTWVEDHRKESTYKWYRTNFDPFYEEAEDNDSHLVTDANRRVITEFLEAQADSLAPKTVGHRFSAISRFYTALRDEIGLLDRDATTPAEKVKRNEVRGLSEQTMTETTSGDSFHYLQADEVSELINNAPAPKLRNEALLRLMANTGMRASEVIQVRTENLDLARNQLTVKSPKLSDPNDPEIITVNWRSDAVSDALDMFLTFRRESYPTAGESPFVFPSKQSEHIGYDQLNRIVKKAAENAGLQGEIGTDASGNPRQEVTSHVLRHSYAMSCLENGMNINEVREALHHEKIETTMTYLREHKDEVRKAILRDGPNF